MSTKACFAHRLFAAVTVLEGQGPAHETHIQTDRIGKGVCILLGFTSEC